jgi:uncharacterized membrane protein YhaH (DUF805 family)
MLEAINDGLRRFNDFKGRSNRLQYNSFFIFYILVDFFINIINPNLTTLNFIIVIMLFVPLLACQIRRSHDVGKSGWWILIPFYSVYLMFKPTVPENPEDKPAL